MHTNVHSDMSDSQSLCEVFFLLRFFFFFCVNEFQGGVLKMHKHTGFSTQTLSSVIHAVSHLPHEQRI